MTHLAALNYRLSFLPIEAQRKFVLETIAHLSPDWTDFDGVLLRVDSVSEVKAALALADWPMPEGVDPVRWAGPAFEPGGYGGVGLREGEVARPVGMAPELGMPYGEDPYARLLREGYPDGNPKTAIGATKLPLDLVPPSAMQYLALAFKDGGAKYGPFNWRDTAVSSTVYYAAALRHLFAWFDGEDKAEDSGVHHLAHVMACCAIILDCEKLNDNRPTPGVAAQMQKEYKA